MSEAQPMAHFQAVPWTDRSRMLIEVGQLRYHPVTGTPAGVEARLVRELPAEATGQISHAHQ